MATKFMTIESNPRKSTQFKSYLDISPDGLMVRSVTTASPDQWDNVMFIGHDRRFGDVFKCWDNDCDDFAIFFGTKGDENY